MVERRVMAMERLEMGTVRSVRSAAVGFGPAAQPRVETAAAARAAERGEERSQAAAWFWSVALAVIVWSVSYLLRQPGVAVSSVAEPFSPAGNFALEGMLLALSWLGVLVTACLAVLMGAARLEDRSRW